MPPLISCCTTAVAIPCVHLSGAASGGNHTWNYVQPENGNWYAADSTWADGSQIDYSYFLAGKSSLNNGGVPFTETHAAPAGNEGLACPPLSDTAYPYLEAVLGDTAKAAETGD